MIQNLIFDLETAPDWERSDLFLPQILEKLVEQAASDRTLTDPPLHDPDAINAQAEMKMSLTPEYCRIIGLNMAIDENEPRSGWVGDVNTAGEIITEEALLRTFWRYAQEAEHIIGFNSLRFDLNVILVRSAMLGVFPTVPFFAAKPWEDRHIDLAQRRTQFGRFQKGDQWHSLKAFRRLYGLPIPEDLQAVALMDGGDVGALYEEWRTALKRANEEYAPDDPAAVNDIRDGLLIEADTTLNTLKSYGKLDAWTTRELARFWGGYYLPVLFQPREKESENVESATDEA